MIPRLITQRQVTHAAGELPSCAPQCGRQPKHYEDRRAAHVNGGHFLECSYCNRSTPRFPTFTLACADWCRQLGTSLPEFRIRSIR
jgi:hypothetical protein